MSGAVSVTGGVTGGVMSDADVLAAARRLDQAERARQQVRLVGRGPRSTIQG